MSVVTKFRFLLAAYDDGALNENISAPARHLFDISNRFSSGTTDGTTTGVPCKFDKVWSDRRTLGATASETLDLSGVLTNSFGQTATFAEVCAILVVNRTTTATSELYVGPNDASNPVGGWWQPATGLDTGSRGSIVYPAVAGPPVVYGMMWKLNPRGQSVTNSSTDLVKVSTPSTGVTYDILFLGRSA